MNQPITSKMMADELIISAPSIVWQTRWKLFSNCPSHNVKCVQNRPWFSVELFVLLCVYHHHNPHIYIYINFTSSWNGRLNEDLFCFFFFVRGMPCIFWSVWQGDQNSFTICPSGLTQAGAYFPVWTGFANAHQRWERGSLSSALSHAQVCSTIVDRISSALPVFPYYRHFCAQPPFSRETGIARKKGPQQTESLLTSTFMFCVSCHLALTFCLMTSSRSSTLCFEGSACKFNRNWDFANISPVTVPRLIVAVLTETATRRLGDDTEHSWRLYSTLWHPLSKHARSTVPTQT